MKQIAETRSRTPQWLQDFRVIEEVLGIPAGAFMRRDNGESLRYCLRRFGFPLTGSDDYKDLCRYLLTTTDKRIGLELIFKADGVYVRALLTGALYSRIHREARAQDLAWRRRRDRWAAKKFKRPVFNTHYYIMPPGKVREREEAIANELYRRYIAGKSGDNKELSKAFMAEEEALRDQWTKEYEAIEPFPAYLEVDETPTGQQVVKVLREALAELIEPVYVRDQYFNFFGAVDDDELDKYEGAEPHWTSGYPASWRHLRPRRGEA